MVSLVIFVLRSFIIFLKTKILYRVAVIRTEARLLFSAQRGNIFF